MPRTITIDPRNPDDTLLREAAAIVKKGGVIIYPTETVYGIGALYSDEVALRRVFAIKQRDFSKPVLLLMHDLDDLTILTKDRSEKALILARQYWPGPLTLLFHAADNLSPLITGINKKIGCRLSSHPVAQGILRHVGEPITSTSANLSGSRNTLNINSLPDFIHNSVDIVIDCGAMSGGLPSTILDTTVEPFALVREGAIPADVILSPENHPQDTSAE